MPADPIYTNPPGSPPIFGAYSHVAIVEPGRLAFIAGQVATDGKGAVVAPGDIAGQVPAVFDNLERILKGLGVDFRAVVSLNTYLVGNDALDAWFKARSAVYERIYPDKSYPPNTLVIVSGLNRPELRVEISAVVKVP